MQRRKGAAGEREFFGILSDHWGQKIARRLGQARMGGHDGEHGRFVFEVKRRKGIAVHEWMEQCEAAIEKLDKPGTPVVACRADGKQWLVILRLEDFVELGREAASRTTAVGGEG